MAGAVAEQRSLERDRYSRVPSAANPLVQAGMDREAVLSRLAGKLARAASRAAGRRRPFRLLAPWPEGRRWAAAFTHDLDVVDWWPLFTGLRTVELAAKGRIGLALGTIAAAFAAARRDPVWRAAAHLVDRENSSRVRSTWFVLCGDPSLRSMRQGDLTYRPDSPRSRRILEALAGNGHEIGLHGSFDTLDHERTFAAQRARLAGLAGQTVTGVRQHFLRMHPGATHRSMAAAGFRYDASYGFPDRNGFRLGVADVVPGWDDASSARSGLEEIPLVWMDRAQSKYQGIEDPRIWVEDALELVDECRAVEGLWVGLWHPNLDPALGYPHAPEAYAALIARVLDRGPWVDSVSAITAWRAGRRAVRVVGIGPDGAVRAVGGTGESADTAYRLEDASGRLLESVGDSDAP
jgi:hypothetical protein